MNKGLLLACAIGASVLGTLFLLGKMGVRQSATGGCLVNFGDGCNVYVTQSYAITESVLTSPLLIGALIAVIVLGGLFLIVTRPRPQ